VLLEHSASRHDAVCPWKSPLYPCYYCLRFGLRLSAFWLSLLLVFALIQSVSAADPSTQIPAPFLRLRDRPLEYTGPKEDGELQNLKEVSIGWFGPHDQTNRLTTDMWWAANLAIREANTQGGTSGLPIRLVGCWSTDPWGTGVSKLARMIYDEHPVAILGSVGSSATHLVEQVVAKVQLPLVSPVTTDSSVTLAGVSWMFACAPTDAEIARVLVSHILAAMTNSNAKLILLT
jgi:branched-chain amino acid transport system substrate-binding protein